MSTHAGGDTTACDAYQYGYDQYFLTDMMRAARADLHEFPIKNLFPLMGQTITTQEFLESVKDESNTTRLKRIVHHPFLIYVILVGN
ncbi:isochorismatase family protein [Streptococcus dysgalactiae]|uniref:isochorismatase family protein n=1 Tax=Streptococcus dysgalactiae TaxID=1334 RepID=UPI002100167C|nr:isochorismatase family protein [Streptococcus dysgalactiae]MEE3742501.1 isochorismatase family protein [Streptococcus dysgalactiae]